MRVPKRSFGFLLLAAFAGIVSAISAGNDFDEFGLGTISSPANAPAAMDKPRPKPCRMAGGISAGRGLPGPLRDGAE